MAKTMEMPMRFIPIGSEFAAEVEGIDLCAPFDAAAVAVIHAGMDRHAVLVFHDQPLTAALHSRSGDCRRLQRRGHLRGGWLARPRLGWRAGSPKPRPREQKSFHGSSAASRAHRCDLSRAFSLMIPKIPVLTQKEMRGKRAAFAHAQI